MNFLREGDTLPAVATLQVLLGRAAPHASLTLDGAYGRLTAEAVRQFESFEHSQVTGQVSNSTWSALMSRCAVQTIDHVDMGDLDQPQVRDITREGGSPISTYGQSNGTIAVMRAIAARAQPGRVALLRLHGHGARGLMNLAAGDQWGSDHHTGISHDTLRRDRATLQSLRSIFLPYASVQLMGCETGGGREGRRLLLGLANLWRVPVSAGVHTQLAGGATTFRFEGQVVSAFPHSGALRSWAHGLRQFARGG